MTLAAVQRGRISQPHRLFIYGKDGVGKSSFAADAPSPIFLGAEDGTAELDVARFPQPRTWPEVGEALKVLYTEDHTYRTLVVDTMDWIEPIIHRVVADDAGVSEIGKIDYGTGYDAAVTMWRVMIENLEYLQAKTGMNVILLAHSQIKTFKNPLGADYDRIQPKLHYKTAALFREWAKAVLYACYEEFAIETKRRVRGVSSGARVMHTVHCAAFDAKNRLGLKDVIPLSWDEYVAGVEAGAPATDKELTEAIEALLAQAPADLVAKVRPKMADASKLPQIHNRLITLLGEEKESA